LFGPLLEQIDDFSELKCTLRLVWLLHQKKGFPRYVTHRELFADRVLARALPGDGEETRAEISRAVALAVRRGIFLTRLVASGESREPVYALNTDADRRALGEDIQSGETLPGEARGVEGWEVAAERPNIFALYEDNIGVLGPVIAQELKEAEESFPQGWIEEAFREAVTNNKRSWRYVAAILERWEREGRSDGEPVRGPKKGRYD
jgi:DnaD/phage-associated family protein